MLSLAPENELLPATGVYVTSAIPLPADRADDNTPDRIEVSFFQFVRHEKKFDNPALLREQITKDVAFAKRVHARLDGVRPAG